MRELLLSGEHATEDDLKAIDKEIKGIVNDAAEFAKESPEPRRGELWTDIYAETKRRRTREGDTEHGNRNSHARPVAHHGRGHAREMAGQGRRHRQSGDILAEIETDKATMEFEAVDEGTIGKILIAEGTEAVKVNTPIAVLLEEGETPTTSTCRRQRRRAPAPRGADTDANAEAAPAAAAPRRPPPRRRPRAATGAPTGPRAPR